MPYELKVDLGIAEILKFIYDIYNQPREAAAKKQDEALTKLHKHLEVILTVVTKLEDLFIEILRGFKDDDILRDADSLKLHLSQTRVFLESRQLLPLLDTAIGAVEAAAFSPKFDNADHQKMVSGLRELCSKLHNFRVALGESGITAPGFGYLMSLCYLAEQQLAVNAPVDPQITKLAGVAFDSYDWQLSSSIRKLIGSVTMNA